VKKIQFTFQGATIYVKYNIEKNAIKNLNNTNLINDENLIFDMRYLKNNLKLVGEFLNVLVKNSKVTKMVIEEEELIETSFDILEYVKDIDDLVIKPDIAVTFNIHQLILRNSTLKTIEVYTIPPYLLERIDTTKTVKIKVRNELFFISSFILINDLTSYSDLFYKKKVLINDDFDDIDKQDFESFLSLNTYLKHIYFDTVNLSIIKEVTNLLKKHDKTNIKLSIKGTKENLKTFSELESYVKKTKFLKKNKYQFRIDYTDEYKRENFIKLLNFTTLKYILIIVLISSIAGYSIRRYDIYKSAQRVNHINDNINDIIEGVIAEESVVQSSQNTESKQKKNSNNPYYKSYSRAISVLKQTNPDTVGWVSVNNTTVNYPVVQAENNSFYLVHDFNRNSNSLGWIFMDYRNDANNLQQNTIMYGHNLAKDKLMFGDLKKTLDPKWYKNPDNQYITFNTANADMQWKIFSIYKVAVTNDYLYNTFDTPEQFTEFINKMKSRSIYNFGVDVPADGKIITLSTCQNSGKNRLVIHAVLI